LARAFDRARATVGDASLAENDLERQIDTPILKLRTPPTGMPRQSLYPIGYIDRRATCNPSDRSTNLGRLGGLS
ncbi:hypothetical protein, partial [Rhizobium sp.]|uniref:hypothetical protein n=1 Tax=Rhizobium sp. TaxID=391 RepID=UPI0028ADCFAA